MKYVLSLILFLAPFGAYAGGSVHHNNTGSASAAAAAAATGGASMAASGDNTFLSSAAPGLSNGWTCAVSTTFGSPIFSLGTTSTDEGCLKWLKAVFACRNQRPDCKEAGDAFMAYEPDRSPEVSTAAE